MSIMLPLWTSLILSGTPEEAEFIHNIASVILYRLAPAIFFLLYFILPSPYGKLSSASWDAWLGPRIPARLAWFLFELPNLIWATLTLHVHVTKMHHSVNVSQYACNYILYALFVGHYLRRTLWYPLHMSSRASPSSLAVVLNALAYTSVNGYLQCQMLLNVHDFPPNEICNGRFVFGVILAVTGMILNAQVDGALRVLRARKKGRPSSSDDGYVIPHGHWLFTHVACPHYLAEIFAWTGLTIACPTVVTASFAAFTAANLIPRAVQQHQWYEKRFGASYSVQRRRAWLPFIW